MPTKFRIPPRHGSRHGSAKLDEDFVSDIRRSAHKMGYASIAKLARMNRVSYATIRDALRGTTYRHVNRVVRPFLGPTRLYRGSVVRIDSKSTHGWQSRYRGTSKFFSDGVWKGKRRALLEARSWLERRSSATPKSSRSRSRKRAKTRAP